MIVVTVVALALANSPLYDFYRFLTSTPIPISVAGHFGPLSLTGWVKDVLMVLFFLFVGLELNREIREGVLAQRDQLLLPLFAAAAGMVVPALLFLGITHSLPEYWAGWAIPSATDIAFALAILILVGRGVVPPAAKIFLLAIAIFDDLGAILIIAFFYNSALHWAPLGFAAIGIIGLIVLSRRKVASLIPYIAIGIFLWGCFHMGGVHTTIAGVLVGLTLPMRSANGEDSPVNRLSDTLHPWVGFGILPIFAFVSAGVRVVGIPLDSLINPLSVGIGAALFFGKQIGIFGATWALIKSGLVNRPAGTNWLQLYGVSVVAGVGFTVSLFIGALAFPGGNQDPIKMGVIGGSLASAAWGAVVFGLAKRHEKGSKLTQRPENTALPSNFER